MKILLINKYLFPKGGDAISTLNTGKLLISKGHEVVFWGMKHRLNAAFSHQDLFVDPVDFNKPVSLKKQFTEVCNILYSLEAKSKIEKLINIEKPDIVHLNNFAHQISPSILHVFKKYRIPVVMTMRDYKLICPTYRLLLKGQPCERCKKGRFYQCFINKCAKGSYFKSAVNTLEMYLHHRLLKIYRLIDVFIAPSRFLLEKTLEFGVKNVVYIPNFVFNEEPLPDYDFKDECVLYFGRLSSEKGILTLLETAKLLKETKFKIIGEGPLKEELAVRKEKEQICNVDLQGYMEGADLKNAIRRAMCTVIPSEWYENNPRTVLESFALGKPVIGARIGGIPELVIENKTGLLFRAGDIVDLKEKIAYLKKDKTLIMALGRNARNFVESNFNVENHYEKLIGIYKRVKEFY